MVRDLVILGDGPHAHEMKSIVDRINRAAPTWRLLDRLPSSEADQDRCFVAFDHGFASPPDIVRGRWATLVDPSCFIAPTAAIESGCVLYPNCFVGHQARLHERVFCLAGAVINHHAIIGPHATLCSGACLAGHVEVGSRAYLGQGCNIRQKVKLGDDCFVGMGAVVLHDVAPGFVVAGNPAKELGPRT